jgi:hypothetical protein
MEKIVGYSFTLAASLLGFCWFSACGPTDDPGVDDAPIPEIVSYNLDIRPILSDNCFACHGPDASKRESGLRLDRSEDAYKALQESPDSHAIVPGNPTSSEAYLRISSKDSSLVMPPPASNLKLSEREIKLIEKWVRQGAKYEPHWAFIPPKKAVLPVIEQNDWPTNELDFFILEQQEKRGLTPNARAKKETLLRRLSFDLTGLPPATEMMDAFLSDDREDAYEQVVDQLLDKKSYGEHMAGYWMDVARYADSHGYQDDYYRTQWPWRDWVIHAFNQNIPYDQFITWQLAGDLLPEANKEHILATGFNRNHKITEESGAIDEEYRVMYVTDRTNTLGKAILGITIECAQCHDHKYDPISQKEYFQLYAFFNNVAEYGIEEATPGFSKKSPAKHPFMEITDEDARGILSFVNKPDSAFLIKSIMGNVEKGANYNALAQEAAHLRVSVMGDLDTLRKSFVLERGVYDAHGEEVTPGTPVSILAFSDQYPDSRLGLSKWLFDPDHPLTARVFVNRIWQNIFGIGLVPTPGDFGMQGELPSHPKLLDWLAVDFMENDWDIKRLIKKIVTSSTYRQSSEINTHYSGEDPDNRYLSRFPRLRLSAVQIRDLVLSTSGLLVPVVGGPSVKPYQPQGLWEAATSGRGNLATYEQDTGIALYRRGLYTFVKRTVPPPAMMIFDASNRDACEVGFQRTSTPLQALVMMNDPTVLEASRVLASRLLTEASSQEQKVQLAFRTIVGRKADTHEMNLLLEYYKSQLQVHRQDHIAAAVLLEVGEYPMDEALDITELAALMQVIQIIFNLEETITKS